MFERLDDIVFAKTNDVVELMTLAGLPASSAMKGADLAGIDLRYKDLRQWDFSGASLIGAYMECAEFPSPMTEEVLLAQLVEAQEGQTAMRPKKPKVSLLLPPKTLSSIKKLKGLTKSDTLENTVSTIIRQGAECYGSKQNSASEYPLDLTGQEREIVLGEFDFETVETYFDVLDQISFHAVVYRLIDLGLDSLLNTIEGNDTSRRTASR